MQARPHAPARFARHLKKHPADITSSNAQRLSGESTTCVTWVGFEDATLPWQKNQSGDWPVSTCFRYSHGTSWNIWWGLMESHVFAFSSPTSGWLPASKLLAVAVDFCSTLFSFDSFGSFHLLCFLWFVLFLFLVFLLLLLLCRFLLVSLFFLLLLFLRLFLSCLCLLFFLLTQLRSFRFLWLRRLWRSMKYLL